MPAVSELRKGELSWLALEGTQVLCERRASDLRRRRMSSLCLTLESLREVVR
jgi:hypothetical protein